MEYANDGLPEGALQITITAIINAGLYAAVGAVKSSDVYIAESNINKFIHPKLNDVVDGQLVAVWSNFLRRFVRGKIHHKMGFQYNVILIDYGLTIESYIRDMRSLPEQFRRIPPQIFILGLHSVLPCYQDMDVFLKKHNREVYEWQQIARNTVYECFNHSDLIYFKHYETINDIQFGDVFVRNDPSQQFEKLQRILINRQQGLYANSKDFHSKIHVVLRKCEIYYSQYLSSHNDEIDENITDGISRHNIYPIPSDIYDSDNTRSDTSIDYNSDSGDDETENVYGGNSKIDCGNVTRNNVDFIPNDNLNVVSIHENGVNRRTNTDSVDIKTKDDLSVASNVSPILSKILKFDNIGMGQNFSSNDVSPAHIRTESKDHRLNDIVKHEETTSSANKRPNVFSSICQSGKYSQKLTRNESESINKDNNSNQNITYIKAYLNNVQNKSEARENISDKPSSNEQRTYGSRGWCDGTIENFTNSSYEKVIEPEITVPSMPVETEITSANGFLKTESSTPLTAIDYHSNLEESFGSRSISRVEGVRPVMVKTNEQFAPVLHLHCLDIDEVTLSSLNSIGIRDLTYLENYAIPAILTKHDVIIVSDPSNPKAFAYVLSLIALLRKSTYKPVDIMTGISCRAIILCPSSKDCVDIRQLFTDNLKGTNDIQICMAYGCGMKREPQLLHDIKICDVLIATPPCLMRLMRMYNQVFNFKKLTHIVLHRIEHLIQNFEQDLHDLLHEVLPDAAPVQKIITSDVWGDKLNSFAHKIIKIEDEILIIASYLEAAIFSKIKTELRILQPDSSDKDRFIRETIQNSTSKTIAIVCSTEEPVFNLKKQLMVTNRRIFLFNDVFLGNIKENVSEWNDAARKNKLLLMICTDAVINALVDVYNVEYLIHYDLPLSKSIFSNRFSLIHEACQNMIKSNALVIVHMNDTRLPQLLDIIRRLRAKITPELENYAQSIKKQQESAKKDQDLCLELKQFGRCLNGGGCEGRHVVLPQDKPADFIPCVGSTVKFNIINVNSANHLTGRISDIWNKNTNSWMPVESSYVKLIYMLNNLERRMYEKASVGDIAAVDSKELVKFERVRVLKLIDDSLAKVKFIDSGPIKTISTSSLLWLPDELREFRSGVVDIFILRLLPIDQDTTWLDGATDFIGKLVKESKGLIDKMKEFGRPFAIEGQIALASGNSVWVYKLGCVEWAKNLRLPEVTFRKKLLDEGLAIDNPTHLENLNTLFQDIISSSTETHLPPIEIAVENENIESKDTVEDAAEKYVEITIVDSECTNKVEQIEAESDIDNLKNLTTDYENKRDDEKLSSTESTEDDDVCDDIDLEISEASNDLDSDEGIEFNFTLEEQSPFIRDLLPLFHFTPEQQQQFIQQLFGSQHPSINNVSSLNNNNMSNSSISIETEGDQDNLYEPTTNDVLKDVIKSEQSANNDIPDLLNDWEKIDETTEACPACKVQSISGENKSFNPQIKWHDDKKILRIVIEFSTDVKKDYFIKPNIVGLGFRGNSYSGEVNVKYHIFISFYVQCTATGLEIHEDERETGIALEIKILCCRFKFYSMKRPDGYFHFHLSLYGPIDVDTFEHYVNGYSVIIKVMKMSEIPWLRLHKDRGCIHWIKRDINRILDPDYSDCMVVPEIESDHYDKNIRYQTDKLIDDDSEDDDSSDDNEID